jgi:hypothetical protein
MSDISVYEYTQMNNDYNCCAKCELWCFHNSSLGLLSEYGPNTWCRCLDCCASCFEYRIKCFSETKHIVNNSEEDPCEVLCCCITCLIL